MLRMLIVDDRKDARETLREIIETELDGQANVAVEDTFPLERVDSYASYVREHEIGALLLDERLNETSSPATGAFTSYFGHDVVSHLRATLPDFPVYMVTTHNGDGALLEKEAEFEDIIDREEFNASPAKYLTRIQRAAARFEESMRGHLTALDELTTKAADGTLTEEEQRRLSSTRSVLGLPYTESSDLVASDLIAEARELAKVSSDLLTRIQQGVKT